MDEKIIEQKPAISLNDYYRSLKPQVYSSEGIDRIIISNSIDANTILRKIPRMIQKPVFLLDKLGNKTELKDEKGSILLNQAGEVQYVISGYDTEQSGYTAVPETCPASEVYSPDMTSTYLTDETYAAVMEMLFEYNYLQVLQMNSKTDYSFEIHQLRNDIQAIIVPAKSLYAGSVQAVKTFRTVNEGNIRNTNEELKKQGFFDKLISGNKSQQQQAQQANKPYYVRQNVPVI